MTLRVSRVFGAAALLLLTALSSQAKQGGLKSSEDRMSPAGRAAAKARQAMAHLSFAKISAPLTSSKTNCDNSPADCPDGYTENPVGGQAETSIAVDSTGKHIVVGYNDTRGFSLNPISVSGYMYSDDGGKTFVDGGQLPSPGDFNLSGTLFPQIFGDPDVKYLGACKFVYSSILLAKFGSASVAQTLGVHTSTDCGHTWKGPFEVTSAINPNGHVTAGSPDDASDKEFMDVDPDTGRLIISWTNFTPTAAEISTTYTDDVFAGSINWSPRQLVAGTPVDGQASIPRFAKGSSNAYVAWRRFPSFYGNSVGFARSTDNGVSWSAPVDLQPQFFTMDQVLGNDRNNTAPSMSVDNSGGPNSGNIYIVYADNDNQDGADVYFQRSQDGGLTFSAPVTLNAKPGNDRAQWFPWVTTDTLTGRVYVYYYNQGVATSGDLTNVAYLYSDNGGKSWKHQRALSNSFKAGWGNDSGQPNLGDYNQAVAQNGELFAVWAGTTLTGFTDGQPSFSMTTPDVYFRRLSQFGEDDDESKTVNVGVSAGVHAPSSLKLPPSNGEDYREKATVLVSENFDESGLAPGILPQGWTAHHGAGNNVVPWTTTSTFCGTHSNAAFHTDAIDGLPPGPMVDTNPARWERLYGPVFTVPADSDFVTVEFDICTDTEDDPYFNIQAYDGAFLRVTDLTPGDTVRSVLAEAFEQKFTTGNLEHYPKHLPRNSDTNYFEDMSAWAGDSQGFKHVSMRLVGMAGTTAQLRFEYTQDESGTCADVRPGHTCGVAIDNLKLSSVKLGRED